MTKTKVRLFAGAFLLTAVLIAGIWGFIAVDLSTDRYMPGTFSPIFMISDVGEQGATLHWMGDTYYLDAQKVAAVQQALWEYRGLIPRSIRAAAGLAMQACTLLQPAP